VNSSKSLQIPRRLAPPIFIDDISRRDTADWPEPAHGVPDRAVRHRSGHRKATRERLLLPSRTANTASSMSHRGRALWLPIACSGQLDRSTNPTCGWASRLRGRGRPSSTRPTRRSPKRWPMRMPEPRSRSRSWSARSGICVWNSTAATERLRGCAAAGFRDHRCDGSRSRLGHSPARVRRFGGFGFPQLVRICG
jgi:hypothetical protein